MAGEIIVTVPDGEGIRKDHWPHDHSFDVVDGCLRIRGPAGELAYFGGVGVVVSIYAHGCWIGLRRAKP